MRQDPDYNQRQYERMLALIEMYRTGEIALPSLVSDIEALISALESVSEEWRNTLLQAWGPLEMTYAGALDRAETEFEAGRAVADSWDPNA